jgi:hypothetical protein
MVLKDEPNLVGLYRRLARTEPVIPLTQALHLKVMSAALTRNPVVIAPFAAARRFRTLMIRDRSHGPGPGDLDPWLHPFPDYRFIPTSTTDSNIPCGVDAHFRWRLLW